MATGVKSFNGSSDGVFFRNFLVVMSLPTE
jgi:hypothetical protein